MKFTLHFKTPDVLDQISSAFGLLPNEVDRNSEDMATVKIIEAENFAKEYIQYSEYIAVEFDTKAKTAVVLKQK